MAKYTVTCRFQAFLDASAEVDAPSEELAIEIAHARVREKCKALEGQLISASVNPEVRFGRLDHDWLSLAHLTQAVPKPAENSENSGNQRR